MAKKTTTQPTLPASKFDGGLLGLIGTSIVAFLSLIAGAAVAAGIAIGGHVFLTPMVMGFVSGLQMDTATLEFVLIVAFYVWLGILGLIALIALCCGLAGTTTITTRWTVHHTIINGKRLRFTGKAIQLFGNSVKWIFLTIITLGIYGLWVSIKYKKWEVKHTVLEDTTSFPVYPTQQASVQQTPSYTAQPQYTANQPQYPAQNGYPTPIVLPPVYPPYAPTYPPVPPCGYNQNKQ